MLDTRFWRKYFSVYDILNELIPYRELLKTIVKKLDVQHSDLILDVGSGTGNLAVAIENKGARVVGIDTSIAGVERHKQKIPNADVRVGDITNGLPFPDNHFDKICSNNVIYLIKEKDREFVFRELYRVLKPGGLIVVSNINNRFRPSKIYLNHVNQTFSANFMKALYDIIRFLPATLKMFHFNRKIRKINRKSGRSFIRPGEQPLLLKATGFTDVSEDNLVYANQAFLTYATKP